MIATSLFNNTDTNSLWATHPELRLDVPWKNCGEDNEILFLAVVGADQWSVLLNAVDEQAFYSLRINDDHVGHFDDWPGFWRWPGFGSDC